MGRGLFKLILCCKSMQWVKMCIHLPPNPIV